MDNKLRNKILRVEREVQEICQEFNPIAAYIGKVNFLAAKERIEYCIEIGKREDYPNKRSILNHTTLSIPPSEYKDDFSFQLTFTSSFRCNIARECKLTTAESLDIFLSHVKL